MATCLGLQISRTARGLRHFRWAGRWVARTERTGEDTAAQRGELVADKVDDALSQLLDGTLLSLRHKVTAAISAFYSQEE